MPGKTAYPGSSELSSFLTSAGLSAGTIDTTEAMYAAKDEFLRRTGANFDLTASIVRRYDPPDDGFLDLGDYLSTCTTLQYQPEGATAETLVVNDDYFLMPHGADALGAPWTWVEFATSRRWTRPVRDADRRSLILTGIWGWPTAYPDEVWVALIQRGASIVHGQNGLVLSVGKTLSSNAGASVAWASDPLGSVAKGWDRYFEAVVQRYRRSRVV